MTKQTSFSPLPYKEKTKLIYQFLDEKKGENILAFDISSNYSLYDALILVSANSNRHAQGLADFLLEQAKIHKLEFLHIEGYQAGQWILVDLNDVVVHILVEEMRQLYRLEDLWAKKSMSLHGTPVSSVE